MKKFAASLGLFALGASALHAAEASTLNNYQRTKPWSIQATLRGFYDDNIGAAQSGSEIDSVGFQISPSAKYGFAGEQTSFNVGYAFTARFYDKSRAIPPASSDKDDYTHTFDADFSHVFSPRLDMFVSESFVIGQEPDLLRDRASTQPISGDNIRNFASIAFNIEATQLLGFNAGYNNSFYDYDAEGAIIGTGPFPGNGIPLGNIQASNSGLLDRMEHDVHIDSQWKLSPQTIGIFGYMYSYADYTGDEAIDPGPPVAMSDSRDSQGHTIYVGAQHAFTPTLSGSVKVGAQRYSYDVPGDQDQWSPYVQSSLRYIYQTATSFDLGFTYSRSAANLGGGAGAVVLDTETAVVYGEVKHELISRLFVTGSATVQSSEYYAPGAPALDGQAFLFYQLGLDLSYQFTPNFSAHAGYNYDKRDADAGTISEYDRNRLYLGVTAGF